MNKYSMPSKIMSYYMCAHKELFYFKWKPIFQQDNSLTRIYLVPQEEFTKNRHHGFFMTFMNEENPSNFKFTWHDEVFEERVVLRNGFESTSCIRSPTRDMTSTRRNRLLDKFQEYLESLEEGKRHMQDIAFIYNEEKTKTKGVQAYLYAYPIISKDHTEKQQDEYLKWCSKDAKAIKEGQWAQPSTDHLNVPKLLNKGFRVLSKADLVLMIGQSNVAKIFQEFNIPVDPCSLQPKDTDRFANLLVAC